MTGSEILATTLLDYFLYFSTGLNRSSSYLLQVSDLLGRRKLLMTFINITRWIRTLHHLRILPFCPFRMLQPLTRRSPYDGEETTIVTMHLTSVVKVISVPPDHLQNQVDVYGMLCKGVDGGVPGAVRCESISVSS